MNTTQPISKAEELGVLDSAINQLGPDSYLGPWLAQVRAEVEADIRSDFRPTITVRDCRKAADAAIADAKHTAEQIVKAAKDKAAGITDHAERTVNSAASALRQALRTLDDR